ncbi:MAG TPA: putative glutamate--cysteine ligase, partial [Thermosynechococcaceae cyanobacterium]
ATRAHELVLITEQNEAAAARSSLDAELLHWRDGQPIQAREWIEQIYQEVWPTAKQQGFSCFLLPLKKLLREGNQAQRWLAQLGQGKEVRQIMQQAIQEAADQELVLQNELCRPLVA